MEKVFEMWERFKDIVRRCQHNIFDLWMQRQNFWDRLRPSARKTLNNAVGGSRMKKIPEEIIAILNELSKDANQ